MEKEIRDIERDKLIMVHNERRKGFGNVNGETKQKQ